MKKTILLLYLSVIIFSETFSQQDTLQATQDMLALQVTTIEVKAINQNVQLLWTVTSNEDAKGYEIERAIDGADFKKIGGKLPSGYAGTASYEFVDALPKKHMAFSYRVKIVAKDGSATYSQYKAIKISDDIIRCRLKQNPVRHSIGVEVVAAEAGNIQVSIYTAYGQKISTETMKLITGVNNITISAQNLVAGIHRLVLETGSERKLLSFVKE